MGLRLGFDQLACPICGAFELCKIQIPTYSPTLPGWGVVGHNIDRCINISAHSICFIQKISGSRSYITHIRVSTLLYTHSRYVVVAAVLTISTFYCALYKRYVVVAAVLPVSASYKTFYTKRIVCPLLLAIYLRPTISLIPRVCMNCRLLQLHLRIAFPLYINHSLTAVLLATFFSYIYM